MHTLTFDQVGIPNAIFADLAFLPPTHMDLQDDEETTNTTCQYQTSTSETLESRTIKEGKGKVIALKRWNMLLMIISNMSAMATKGMEVKGNVW